MIVQRIFMTPRQNRGLEIARTSRIMRTERGWMVPSQSGRGAYLVDVEDHDYRCTCPDCQFRRQKCKHIWAVEYWTTREIDMNGKEAITNGMRVTYSQNWPAYNKAQTQEGALFMKLLSALCNNIEQTEYKFGRPTLPLSDMVFSSALKVYSTFSLRRFVSLMENAKKEGHIDKVCSYSTVSNYMRKPEMTPILKYLITKSSLALRLIETSFAVDSTGFSTSQFARWFSFKYGKESNFRIWLKAHIMCGTKTNIVTSVEVTRGSASDTKQFNTLVSQTAENFEVEEISADKAYSSRDNLKHVKEIGAMPYIPFKTNSKSTSRGLPFWNKMWHYYNLHREEFLQHYHKRSNVETAVYMIKTKFGSRLRSKDRVSQTNELLLKVLCHNICVVIQEVHELDMNPNSKLY